MPGITVSGVSIRDAGRAVVPTVNTWSRLEGLPLSADLEPALRAAVADPLWLLCRQWQFLEFAGEDAGTPIEVRVEGERASLSRYHAGRPAGGAAGTARDYSSDAMPLEVAVEAEPVRRHHTRLAVEAGVHLQWMLNNGRLNDLFVTAYPLEGDPGPEADTSGRDWWTVARLRGLDARRLLAALAPLRDPTGRLTELPPQPVVPAELRDKTLDVLRRWITWYEGALVDPAEADAAWNPHRLEYAFAVSAHTGAGELVLSADEYADGALDWYSVSPGGGSLGAVPVTPAALSPRPLLASPVEYPGKPADRFWEFEDSTIHFGAIDAGPTDLTRMLLVEFGLVYGNDWYVVPVRLPVGSLFRVTSCTVRDTFGVVTAIGRAGDADWAVFDVAGDHVFLPPTLAQTIEGEPIEQVHLCRDESANLSWGIERYVPGPSGDRYERADEISVGAARPGLDGPPVEAALVYRLATDVPEHWIPFVPVAAGPPGTRNPVIRLERRALRRTEADGQTRSVHPKGLLLRSDPAQPPGTEPPLRLEEEEVPREGATVERSFQYARWFDGRSLLWLGRRKHAGRGEQSSNLRFDSLHRPGPARPPTEPGPAAR
jgi:hypothetical protein